MKGMGRAYQLSLMALLCKMSCAKNVHMAHHTSNVPVPIPAPTFPPSVKSIARTHSPTLQPTRQTPSPSEPPAGVKKSVLSCDPGACNVCIGAKKCCSPKVHRNGGCSDCVEPLGCKIAQGMLLTYPTAPPSWVVRRAVPNRPRPPHPRPTPLGGFYHPPTPFPTSKMVVKAWHTPTSSTACALPKSQTSIFKHHVDHDGLVVLQEQGHRCTTKDKEHGRVVKNGDHVIGKKSQTTFTTNFTLTTCEFK